MKKKKPSNTLQTLDRGLAVLELLTTGEMGPTEIAHTLDLDRTVVHRILRTLIERGFVEQVAGGCYRVNLQHLLGLAEGTSSLRSQNWLTSAPAWLESLRAATGLSANLCVPNVGEMVYIMQALATDVVAVNSPPGTRRPLYCSAVGKAYLGALPESELDRLVPDLDMQPLTSNTVTSIEALKRQLAKGRARGYYVDDGEVDPFVICIASPILSRSGVCIASVGVSGPRTAPAFEEIEKPGVLVADTANRISATFGAPAGRTAKRG